MTRATEGFTLLEVLVAVVVLGLVLAGLSQGTQFGLRAAQRQSSQIAAAGDMDAAERVLRRLIEQMAPGTTTHAAFLAAGATSLGFTTDLAAAAPALGTGQADVSIGVSTDHRLVLRWTRHLHAALLGPTPAAQETTLLPDVTRVEFSYWGAAGTWQRAWAGEGPPELVRMRFVFDAAIGRSWPDLIAKPMRRRLNG